MLGLRTKEGLPEKVRNIKVTIQGGRGTGKTGNLDVNFSRQRKHREFAKKCFYTGTLPPTWGNFRTV